MRRLIVPCIIILLLTTAEVNSKTVTLRCTRGYSVTITFTLWYPGQEPPNDRVTHTLTCPPPAQVEVPDGYDRIEATGRMTGPGGTVTDLTLPADNGTPAGSAGGTAPWPPLGYPRFVSYYGSASGWERDPQAPPFLQDGELLLGQYDKGTNCQFTVRVLDAVSGSPITGASVTALKANDDSPAATGSTNSEGKLTLNLEAGGDYYIKAESTDHFPQVSDAFQLLGTHMWTMILTPGNANVGGLSRIVLGIGILLLLILLIFFGLSRRRQSP